MDRETSRLEAMMVIVPKFYGGVLYHLGCLLEAINVRVLPVFHRLKVLRAIAS